MRFISFILFGIWSIERSANVYAAVRPPLGGSDQALAAYGIKFRDTRQPVAKPQQAQRSATAAVRSRPPLKRAAHALQHGIRLGDTPKPVVEHPQAQSSATAAVFSSGTPLGATDHSLASLGIRLGGKKPKAFSNPPQAPRAASAAVGSRSPLGAIDHLLLSHEIGLGDNPQPVSKDPLPQVSKVAKTGGTGEALPFGITKVPFVIKEVPHEPRPPKLVKGISKEERIERVLPVKRALERAFARGEDIEGALLRIIRLLMNGYDLSVGEAKLLMDEAALLYFHEKAASTESTKTV